MPRVFGDGLAENAFQIALLIGVAEKFEGADVHGGEVIAVFIATGRRGDGDHRNFCGRAADVASEVLERSIFKPIPAETRGNVFCVEDPCCFGDAGDPFSIDREGR